jgi:hypothetical protein
MPGKARSQLGLFQQNQILHATFGEMITNTPADNATTNDDNTSLRRDARHWCRLNSDPLRLRIVERLESGPRRKGLARDLQRIVRGQHVVLLLLGPAGDIAEANGFAEDVALSA